MRAGGGDRHDLLVLDEDICRHGLVGGDDRAVGDDRSHPLTPSAVAATASLSIFEPFVGFFFGQGQRRSDPQHVAEHAALADQQPAGPGFLHDPAGRLRVGVLAAGSDQFDPDHQALAAHVTDDLVLVGQVIDPGPEMLTDLEAVGLQIVLEQVLEVGQRPGGGERDCRRRWKSNWPSDNP